MSLYGALYAGVAGLNAQSNKLGVISDNIANVNTIGYKEGAASFETLVTTANNATAYSPGGVLGGNQQQVSQQGLLQTTTSPTDIAVSGAGLFVVNQAADSTGQVLYTRAGSFTQDSNGNFVNTAGYFLQAWPLDSNGDLPGAPGNANTTSSANLTSLKTVNVQDVTGTATASTEVSIGANLNAGQTAAVGAGVVAGMDSKDAINANNTAANLIIPTGVDSLKSGDQFGITTASGSVNATYTYGGFTFSRSVTESGNPGDLGDSGTPINATPASLKNIVLNFNSSTPTSVVINADPTTLGLSVGSVIKLANTSTDIGVDGLNGIDGLAYVSAVNGTSDFTVTIPAASAPAPQSTTGDTYSIVDATHMSITLASIPAGMKIGDNVELAGCPTIGANLGSSLDGTRAITNIAGNVVTFAVPSDGTVGSAAGGASATIFDDDATFSAGSTATYTNRLFSATGDIMDATTPTQTFLGITGTSSFTSSALTFTISTPATGTVTFTYTASAPNAQLGQFNNLTNLAGAINDVTGLSARVSGGHLYVGATDANAAVTFANGATAGTAGPPVQSGIDWVGELGLKNVPSSSSISSSLVRFNSLESLNTDIGNTSGLTGTLKNPEGDASLDIDADSPLDTITFADGPTSGSNTNTGSPLAALGISTSLNSGPVTQATVGPLGPAYDPLDPTKNMASGSTPAQFSRPVTVFDGQGSAHNLNVAFLKTGTNTWAVEIYAQPGTDVAASIDDSSPSDGLIANGTLTFDGSGNLLSASSGLLNPITVDWTNGSSPSTLNFNWGTDGKTDGFSQFNSGYDVNFVNQNGTPVGQLTGVSINSQGYIIASYNNGETQKLYKIPLAEFTDPNQLQAISGNAYEQTSGSGEVNLKQSGQSGVGTISSGALEESNVELGTQLTDMIIAQQAYEANTKIIRSVDTLLSDLNQIFQ